MATILVTGGAGYIGSHAAKALAEAGHRPVVVDDLSTGHRDFVRWGPLVEADLRDGVALKAAFAEHRPDGVIHFAATSIVGASVTDPAACYANNLGGTLALLAAMRNAGTKALVFSSTCAVYGETREQPIREDTALAPVSPYGRSKLMIEQMLADYRAAYGLASLSLRYFNASGASRDGEIGERHADESHLVPRAVLSALGRLDGFAVFGTDYDTPDGSALRDYIHVEDLAEAHVRAVERLLGGEAPPRGAYNIGSGTAHSVLEIVGAVGRALGSNVPVTFEPRRAGDAPVLLADPRAALDDLGFAASRSDLDNIIRTAAAWHRSEEGL